MKKTIIKHLNAGIVLSLAVISVHSHAVEPSLENLLISYNVQGQRVNIYNGCREGTVTCDDMLLEAPDLRNLLNMLGYADDSPPTVQYYPAETMHSTCQDGTPCQFQGYYFGNDDVHGYFIVYDDMVIKFSELDFDPNKSVSLPYEDEGRDEHHGAPLEATKTFIDTMYAESDRMLNEAFDTAYADVVSMYGVEYASKYTQDQVDWIVKRSRDCGADAKHLPRTQIETACFIEENNDRLRDYFLWY